MTALLVIDMLEDFFADGKLKDQRGSLTASINRLVDWARTGDMPIFWVRQEFAHDLSDAFLAMRRNQVRITMAGTPGSRILHELNRHDEDFEVVKKRYSAFFETDLDELLRRAGIDHLILAGVNTHACIRTAAIDAYQRDLLVTIPRECVSSSDHEHHEITLAYLGGEIAEVVSVDTLTAGRGAE